MEPQAVEQLFFTDGQDIVVNLTHAVVDVHRFRAHINEGHEADNDGRIADALAHYYAAERLCRSDLFGGEPNEEWFLPQCEVYRGMLAFVIERIAALRTEIDEEETLDMDVSVSAT